VSVYHRAVTRFALERPSAQYTTTQVVFPLEPEQTAHNPRNEINR
jgi:hypothetical protein